MRRSGIGFAKPPPGANNTMSRLSATPGMEFRNEKTAWQASDDRPGRVKPFALLRWAVRGCLMPVARLAGRAYVAGDRLEDALRVAKRHGDAGYGATLGFFDSEDQDTPRMVADAYLATIRALSGGGNYVSIKLPALAFSQELLDEVARQAKREGVPLHFDGMWPETASATIAVIDKMLGVEACGPLGITLPTRWRRSTSDARWAKERGLYVRVVKGQWADPCEPDGDLRERYMDVIRVLAGRRNLVAVASHDTPMAEAAIRVLQAAKTPCVLELLHGLPMRASLKMAERLGVKVRVYVPFGRGHLPYAIAQIIHKPRMAWWLVRDLVGLAG